MLFWQIEKIVVTIYSSLLRDTHKNTRIILPDRSNNSFPPSLGLPHRTSKSYHTLQAHTFIFLYHEYCIFAKLLWFYSGNVTLFSIFCIDNLAFTFNEANSVINVWSWATVSLFNPFSSFILNYSDYILPPVSLVERYRILFFFYISLI